MQIHLIGHASLFVETQDCKILMDPILSDSGISGAVEDICPSRQIIPEKIPDFDILIISHRHIDHFDIHSLASLPKHVDVLIPKDKFMKDCLYRLGYRNIYFLKHLNEVRIGETRLLVTPSESDIPEFGIIFADHSGVFWNQVDSVVTPEIVSKVKSYYPDIDFLLSGWQPFLQTQYQFNQSLNFPYSSYNDMITNINLIAPKAIAPGASGFKQIKGSSWLNQIVFPVTREQFCEDVKQVYPEIGNQVLIFDPGDIVSLHNRTVHYFPQKSEFVKKIANNYNDDLYFSPVNLDSKLRDDNPDRYDIEEMRNVIFSEVNVNLPNFIQSHKQSLFLEHFHWKIIYQLEVVFPNNSESGYFDFSEDIIQCHKGKNSLANVFSYISASSFYGILKGFKGWEWVELGGYHRCFHKVYQATPYGIIKPIEDPDHPTPDILNLKFPSEEVYKKARNFEIEKWGQIGDNQLTKQQTKNTMVRIGNTLTKPLK